MTDLISKIKSDTRLQKFLCETCSENNIEATFDEGISANDFVVVKVDNYYNSLLEKSPPSPDCLIVLKCENSGYSLTIIELKSISSSKGFTIDNMIKKFETCIHDFIETRFEDLLYVDYKNIKLFFISNIELYQRDIGLKMELLINTRFKYKNKTLMIKPYKPIPIIKKCY